jgi:hypothetical protein
MKVSQVDIPQMRLNHRTHTFYTEYVKRWCIVEDSGELWRGEHAFPFYAAFRFRDEAEKHLTTLKNVQTHRRP